MFFFLFFFWSYEITVYCFSSCLTLIVFSPYTTEVHREYVPVWRGMVHGLQFYFFVAVPIYRVILEVVLTLVSTEHT